MLWIFIFYGASAKSNHSFPFICVSYIPGNVKNPCIFFLGPFNQTFPFWWCHRVGLGSLFGLLPVVSCFDCYSSLWKGMELAWVSSRSIIPSPQASRDLALSAALPFAALWFRLSPLFERAIGEQSGQAIHELFLYSLGSWKNMLSKWNGFFLLF